MPLKGSHSWGLTAIREELARDDSLAAFAAARQMFGVTLGKKERGRT